VINGLNSGPLLMVVLTIEGEDGGADVKFEVRLRVFLCPRAAHIDDYRMSLCGIHAPMI
jgi:hypothetical protein